MTGGRKEDDKPLSSSAVESVQDAVGRGLHRRARREQLLGRRSARNNSPPSVPAPRNIIVGTRPKGDPPTGSSLPYHVPRGDALIRGDASSDEDDSNDEWEEHVDVDERTARRAVHRAEKAAARRAARAERAGAAAARKAEAEAAAKLKAAEPTAAQLAEVAKKVARAKAARQRTSDTRIHEMHLLLLTGVVSRMDIGADNAELQAFALSIAPPDALPSNGVPREALARFALWARAHFRLTPLFPSATRRTRSCSQVARAQRALVTSSAHVLDLAVLLAAVLRADGARARVVVPLRPAPERPPAAALRKSGKSGKKEATVVKSGAAARAAASGAALNEPGADLYAWLEVWSESDKVWTPIDFVTGFVGTTDCDQVLNAMREHARTLQLRADLNTASLSKSARSKDARARKQRIDSAVASIDATWLARVVAAEHGVLVDVTRRYVQQWRAVEKERGRTRTLERVLEEVSRPVDRDDKALLAEQKLFDELAADDSMPTSVAALHKHPRYVLERHLKKYEALYPRGPIVGHFKKEPIFLRSRVHLLHTRERWTRKMRCVRDGEKPFKHVKSVLRDSEDKTPLFGEWQTDALVIPAVVDGIVPRSTRGNIELWTPEHLPKGGVHVASRFATAAARALDLSYAPAMTGFDIRSGRSVPRIEGVVVAAEHADAVRAAAAEKENAAHERAESRAREDAAQRWRALLKTMLAREKVRKKYGGLITDDGTYESVQKRQGIKRARDEKMAEGGDLGAQKRLAADDSGGDRGSTARAFKRGTAEVHKHEFVNQRELDGSEWVKTCRLCKLDVIFEKL